MERLKADFRDKELFVRLFGADAYAVGGYVRDLIRGIPSGDVDILIARHNIEEIVGRIRPHGKVDLVGKSFGIIKFTIKGKTYDIALPRKDAPHCAGLPGHKDFIISADPQLPIEKDLERRDFRCNSLAMRLSDGALIDPFEGYKDTRARLIRLTNPATFPEDPLRVLRVARFSSVLGFGVDPAIYEITKNIDLSGLSVERVNDELFKILLFSAKPSVGLEEMFKVGALGQLFPELYRLTLSIQDSVFHPEKDDFGHHTVWQHVKLTVDQAKRIADLAELQAGRRLALLLAALYHDVGKPQTAEWEFKKGRMAITNNCHDVESEKTVKKILGRFRIFSWNGINLKKIVPVLIKSHHRLSDIWAHRESVTKKAFNRLAVDTEGEIDLLIHLDAADRAGRRAGPVKSFDRQARWFLRQFEVWNVSRETIKPLLMGRDLIKLGVAPGPEMGKILKKLYKAQLDNEFETKAKGLKLAANIIQGKKR